MMRSVPRWAIPLLAVSVLSLVIAGCAPAVPLQVQRPLSPQDIPAPVRVAGEVWFDSIDSQSPLSEADSLALTRYAAARILTPENAGEPPAIVAQDEAARIVFLSVSDGQGPALVARGAGEGVGAALDEALGLLQPILEASGSQPQWVKLDVVTEVQRLENVPVDEPQPAELERSLYGLAFEWGSGAAFLPEELVARTLIDSQQQIRFNNMARYAGLSTSSTSDLTQLSNADRLTVYRFLTQSAFSDGGEPLPLYRGHRLYDPVAITPDLLLEASLAAGDYLIRAVDPDGRFDYAYLPKSDSSQESYNILRHGGTTYSMFELYAVTRDAELLEAGKRALDYLMRQAMPCELNGVEALCIVEAGEVKLGGNGLAAIALVKYMVETGDMTYLPELRELGRWMQAAQGESGEFEVHKMTYPGGEADDFRSIYYPGEALLALARIYSVDPDEAWLDTAERGAQWLINVRDGDKETQQLPHDHWLLYALHDLYRYRSDPLYLEHAMRITEAIITSQHRDPPYPDWVGGYYRPPRSTPTATRSEGLMASYKLARDNNMPEEAAWIMEAVRYGVAFQLQTQFTPERVMYLNNPQYTLGGFSRDMDNYEIRIDYVQHNLSSLVELREALLADGDL